MLVEGGAKLLQSFIDEGIWDETRVVSSVELRPDSYRDSSGLAAPVFANAIKTSEQMIITDKIEIYEPKHS